jgi:acetoacetyl-CoA synthetase
MNKPIWEPGTERIERANLNRFMRFVRESTGNEDIRRHAPLYDFSIRHPEKFWSLVWEFCGIRAHGEHDPVLIDREMMPGARWFPNVTLNFAQNLLRYKDDRCAIVFRNEWGHQREFTYAELHAEVGRLAHALKSAGVGVGDRVAGFLPNIPEAVIAMLAATALGATWSSCSPDFGVSDVVDRLGQIAPKVLFTADMHGHGGKRFDCLARVRDVLRQLPSVERLVVISYSGEPLRFEGLLGAIAWPDFVGKDNHGLEFEALPFDHPICITYSSTTTGVPDCIVHGAGGTLIQHLKELVLHTDLKREDRLFHDTNRDGRIWNWLVSGLAVGATLVLYDGSALHPDGNVLWDLVDEVGVSVLGTGAEWISAIGKTGLKPRETHKLLSLKTILSIGAPLASESYDYVYRDIKERVLLASIPGGTGIVSSFALGSPLLPVYRGEVQCRGLGMKVEVLNDDGKPVRGEKGRLACTAPFPSMPVFFWNDPDGEKYRAALFSRAPNACCHGDHALLTERDGVIIYDRSGRTGAGSD